MPTSARKPAGTRQRHKRSIPDGHVIAWENPVNAGGNGHQTSWKSISEELKARPGVWGLVRTNKTINTLSAARASILSGRYQGMTPGEFDAVSSKRLNGSEYGLYVRYVGPDGIHRPKDEAVLAFGEEPAG